MQSQLREAAFRICSEEEVIGAMGLINHLSKACFVQGLINERVQTIVRAKGETALLSTCIDCALEGESAIMSEKERSFSAQKVNRGLEVAGSIRGNPCVNMFKGSGRGPGFANREVNRENRPTHPGRGVRVDVNRIASFNAHVSARERLRESSVFHVQSMGTWREIVRREISRHGDEEVIWETKWRDGRAALLNPSSDVVLY
jgi:hypothetical protein